MTPPLGYLKPGPVWHASVAGQGLSRDELERRARHALAGVGDRSQEWRGRGEIAFHLRRRLTEKEQLLVGPAVDIRGTAEVERRLALVRQWLPKGYSE